MTFATRHSHLVKRRRAHVPVDRLQIAEALGLKPEGASALCHDISCRSSPTRREILLMARKGLTTCRLNRISIGAAAPSGKEPLKAVSKKGKQFHGLEKER